MRPKTKTRSGQDARSRPPEKGASPVSHPADLDDALLDIVQKQTLGHFWDFAHTETAWLENAARSDQSTAWRS